MHDIIYALRVLRRSPGFAITAVLTLALGIGASTAVFTVVDSVVLKPLDYRDSGRLVAAWELVWFLPGETGPNPRHADFWAKRATSFSGLTLIRHGAVGLTLGNEHPRLVGMVTAYANLFDVLQVTPLLGRVFQPQDGVKGRGDVAILTYPLWQSLFRADPNVIGKTLHLAGIPRQVIGILPPDFHFPNSNALRAFRSKQPTSSPPEPAVFVPAVIDPSRFGWNGDYGNWVALARLKPGIGIGQAEAQLNSIQAQILQEMPAGARPSQPGALRAAVQPMQEAVVGESKTGLWLLMAAVSGLMLIGCINLANAQLGRALSRQREAAIRAALGAAKWRLLWNSLSESLTLAAMGGAGGVLLAALGLHLFRRYSPVDLPRMAEVGLNVTVLVFAMAVTFGSSILFGTLPAVKLLRAGPQEALQQGSSRTLGSRQSRWLRTWLIGLQVFGCTVLLLITGLFSKSLLFLLHQDKGFDTGHVAVAETRLPPNSYATNQSRAAFDDAVLRNLREIPGVQSAGLVSAMPLEGETWIEGLERADRQVPNAPLINLRWASPGYFETVRAKLVAGRFFEERDRNLNSVILSEGEAKALWQGENPIGGQVKLRRKTRTVIGVVSDSRNTSLKSPPAKMAYLPYTDEPPGVSYFVARGAQPAAELVTSMRDAIWKQAPDVTIARVKTLDSQLRDSLAAERFQTAVLLSFGIAALLLAMLGIYGVLSYATVMRRQEIGVRMALGATRRRIYMLTLGEAGAPVFAGLGAGIAASMLAGNLIQKLLYGIQAVEPAVMLIVAGLFVIAAAAAALVPARRAASVDPMEALRSE